MYKVITMVLLLFLYFLPADIFSQQYILLGWNDLGMHCSNKDFSKIGVLPPYNNVHAQIIKKIPGQLPQIVTAGFTIEYSIPNNTYSAGKTNFWTYAQQLFNLPQPLPLNIGLTGKGMTGTLDISGNNFVAEGIPVTPFKDSNWTQEKPFQLIHLVAKLNGIQIQTTDCVIPVSNEIGCVQSGCHSSEQNIINSHEQVPGFNVTPILCAKCHASNALGTVGDTVNAKIFSYRIHEKHSFMQPVNNIDVCYKCHPGPNTRCLRCVMSTNIGNPLVCQNCHGTMEQIAQSIQGGRRPWIDEPKCGSVMCHGSNFAEEPGKIFKQSRGHAGLFCSACHSSPHAILPSRELNDNLQNINYQGHAGTLNDCNVCHSVPPTGPGPHGITSIGVRQLNTEVPGSFKVYQNYPNPFNPATRIKFDLPKFMHVSIKVYNISGKEITTLAEGVMSAGKYEVKWNAEIYSSGTYFCVIKTELSSIVKRMILIK
jgi:hypothetical protein